MVRGENEAAGGAEGVSGGMIELDGGSVAVGAGLGGGGGGHGHLGFALCFERDDVWNWCRFGRYMMAYKG